MSIRAYKIKQIIQSEQPTQGIMEQEVLDLACRHYRSDESGELFMLEYEKEQVIEAQQKFLQDNNTKLAETCQNILNDFEEDEEYLEYQLI